MPFMTGVECPKCRVEGLLDARPWNVQPNRPTGLSLFCMGCSHLVVINLDILKAYDLTGVAQEFSGEPQDRD